jgi:hypothetical protein
MIYGTDDCATPPETLTGRIQVQVEFRNGKWLISIADEDCIKKQYESDHMPKLTDLRPTRPPSKSSAVLESTKTPSDLEGMREFVIEFQPPVGNITHLKCVEGDAAGYGWHVKIDEEWINGYIVDRTHLKEVWDVAGAFFEKMGVYNTPALD